MIIKVKEIDYNRTRDVLMNGVELPAYEQGLLEDALRKYRKGNAFDDLLPLDQIEILYWAVGRALENEYDAPNLNFLLKSIILERMKNGLLYKNTWFEIEKMVFDEIVACYESLKDQTTPGLL